MFAKGCCFGQKDAVFEVFFLVPGFAPWGAAEEGDYLGSRNPWPGGVVEFRGICRGFFGGAQRSEAGKGGIRFQGCVLRVFIFECFFIDNR